VQCRGTETVFKEKHGLWDPAPELTKTSPYVNSRVDCNTCTMGNPMPESTLTLCQSQLHPQVRDLEFGLRGVRVGMSTVVRANNRKEELSRTLNFII
jgi:hypothetical protein